MILLGKKLRKLRRDKELTQQQIADTLGLTRAAYASYELSRRQPDHQTILRLAKLFNVTTDYLINNEIK